MCSRESRTARYKNEQLIERGLPCGGRLTSSLKFSRLLASCLVRLTAIGCSEPCRYIGIWLTFTQHTILQHFHISGRLHPWYLQLLFSGLPVLTNLAWRSVVLHSVPPLHISFKLCPLHTVYLDLFFKWTSTCSFMGATEESYIAILHLSVFIKRQIIWGGRWEWGEGVGWLIR